ncbi:hypothetical protein BGW36DRAFT_430196 [Talaromyces proteolyticus]|uniref:Xylanolytic transcriptional activator regulatory domain-containing protein n=1 Tax=Talaromyces proteolyticus TaxID=1131652 RepID=A0AAD4KM53_9EURO|nr:uncharacterized protein BGW36DRAFT_430196 [Talaromyces proteolyticus]KAH8694176.1 hypothetical protein BGW36DRAFT_430196 [Talaromyces proteolyticus]
MTNWHISAVYANDSSVGMTYFVATQSYIIRVIHASLSPAMPAVLTKLNALVGLNAYYSKNASTTDGSTALNASISKDVNDDDKPMSPANSRLENFQAEYTLRTERESNLSNLEFLKNLTILPSDPSLTSFRPLSRGMEALYEIMVAEKPSLEGAMQESAELQEWVTKCLETYSRTFHLRWPILHSPTLDMEISSMSLPLAASVCIIGVWFRSTTEWTERFYALRVHETLLQRLLHNLIDSQLMFGGQPWPIELFQAVLLTLIFSLYRTDKSALSRAKLLRSTFITILRDLGAFNAEPLIKHLQTHFSGTYAPYTLNMREKFKRLLVWTYQFDVYFSLSHEMPPILHRQQIDVGLPSTFALWNTYGLDIFAIRQPEEPPERSAFPISEMTNRPGSIISLQLLVEDVQMGLCGLVQAIWVLSRSFPSKTSGYSGNGLQNELLIEALDGWKYELDKINKLVDPRNINSNAARYLLLAYRGDDDSAAASIKRIITLVQDGMVLYYYLKMYHYTGLGTIGIARLTKQLDDPLTEIWRTSKYGREALVCALQILKITESIGATEALLNPLIRHALAMGCNVIMVLVSSQKYQCITKQCQHSVDLNVQQWTESGGPVLIDGTPVCACKLKVWTEKFDKAIQGQMTMVEEFDSTESA